MTHLSLFLLLIQAPTKEEWDTAAEQIVRLSPMEFEEVPIGVRERLVELGCTIPQPALKGKRNIVSGEFAAAGQTDWAALCSRDGRSNIVVLWGGPNRCPAMNEERPDRKYLQTGLYEVDDGWKSGIIFSRLIFKTPASVAARYGTSAILPESRTHDSVGSAFLGKAASAHYCHEMNWITFQTAD